MNQDTCHCCEVPEPATPAPGHNRPALSAIAFRVGTYASFRRAMLQEISRHPELAYLRTRLDEDYSITILDLWAIVSDVLAFYQERIANESYVRTARLRDSLLRLVRLLDYHLRPGVAATTLLAITVEKDRLVRVPAGLLVQSVPAQDEKPQKFETIEPVVATPFWNKVRIVPAPIAVNPLGRGSTRALLTPGAKGLALAARIAPETKLVLFNATTPSPVEEIAVDKVVFADDRIEVWWKTPIQQNAWTLGTHVCPYTRTFRLFGHNAVSPFMRPAPPPPGKTSVVWSLVTLTAADFTVSGSVLPLDGRWEGIRTGTRLLAVGATGALGVYSVTAVDQVAGELGSMKDTVTRVTMSGTLPATDRRRVVLYELGDYELELWGLSYPDRVNAARVHVGGIRLGGTRLLAGRTVDRKGFSGGTPVDVQTIEKGRRVILADARQPPVSGTIVSASISGADISPGPTPLDQTTVRQLGLAADQALPVTALVSGRFAAPPAITSPLGEIAVTIGVAGPRLVAVAAAPATLPALATSLETALNAADSNPLFANARVRVVDNRLLILPGIAGAEVTIRPSPNDPTTATELHLDVDQTRGVAGIASAPIGVLPLLVNPSRAMLITIGAFGPRQVQLPTQPATLQAAAALLQQALNGADPAPLFQRARTVVVDTRILIFPGVVGGEIQEYLRLDLALDQGAMLDAATTWLHGNVAEASHGETIQDEVLGDGDASDSFQRFELQKKPLTYVPSGSDSGVDSTLRVLVNRMLWREVPTLFGAAPTDHVYVARTADDGTTTVQFGEGRRGARLPSGRANVQATYRQGSGVEGRVGARRLTIPLDSPVGMKAVTNPLPAEGGGNPERLERARENAPQTVVTFGRAVSLRDFASLVASRPDVAKAAATWAWHGDSKAIHVTVAGEQAGTFSRAALAKIHASLDQQRDRNYTLLLDNFVRVPIVVTATLRVMPTFIASEVRAAARRALSEALAFEQLEFGAPVHLSDVYAVLQQVDGVQSVDIDRLHFKDQSPSHLLARGATFDAVQRRLVIFAARPAPAPPPLVRPAEQAWVEVPANDLTIQTVGGLPD
jgi:hypothetical protein